MTADPPSIVTADSAKISQTHTWRLRRNGFAKGNVRGLHRPGGVDRACTHETSATHIHTITQVMEWLERDQSDRAIARNLGCPGSPCASTTSS